MTQSIRLFIGSDVSGSLRNVIDSIYQQRDTIADKIPQRVRWGNPEQWHLTWLFLGNVPSDQLPSIQSRLTDALASLKPATMELQDIIFWPSGKKPKMIVARLSHSQQLARIAEAIRQALPDYPADKPFNPHLTLARLKDNPQTTSHQKPGWTFTPSLPANCLAETVTLYQSTLTPGGPIYQPVHIVPLANTN